MRSLDLPSLLLSVSLGAALVAGCDARPSPSSPAPAMTAPVAYTLRVKGMHCEGCEGAIVDKVTKVAGVSACKASHTAESVEVVAPIEQKAAISAAIKKLGYTLED